MLVAALPVAAAAAYGAYFGAGMGVILLAIISVVVDDKLIRTNALKQLLSLLINTVAAVVFLVIGKIEWSVALVIAVASLAGGLFGGRLAPMVAHFSERRKLSKKDIAELKKLIQELDDGQ